MGILEKILKKLERLSSKFWISIQYIVILIGNRKVRNAFRIHTHMSKAELIYLYEIGLQNLRINPGNLLEIGSYLGASSCFLGLAASKVNKILMCIDTWENQTMPDGEKDTLTEFTKNTNRLSENIQMIKKNSRDLTAADIKRPLSFAFIDGDHSYEMAKIDFENVHQWLSVGGIIAFHDCIHFQGVSKVIGEALASGEYQLVERTDNLLFIKKSTKEMFKHN